MKKFLKKSRKGFTLVELLIVIIILGALAATMMLSSGNSVASAKANTILTNMGTIKNGALVYLNDTINGAPTYTDFMDSGDKYVGMKFTKGTEEGAVAEATAGSATYTVLTGWIVQAKVKTGDADEAEIIAILDANNLINGSNGTYTLKIR